MAKKNKAEQTTDQKVERVERAAADVIALYLTSRRADADLVDRTRVAVVAFGLVQRRREALNQPTVIPGYAIPLVGPRLIGTAEPLS